MRWSSGPVSLVEAEKDTTYVFPEKGTGGTLTVVFMKSILKHFVCTVVGGQGLRDDYAPSSAKSNRFCMGTRPMLPFLPKVINCAWAHAQCPQFCQKEYILHGYMPTTLRSANSNKFCMGTRPMLPVLPKVINSAWAHTQCPKFCQK